MRKPANPFIVAGYHSPDYFCDRQKELKWLLEQIKNERNAVIHSWRRMGKSALIRHLFFLLKQKQEAKTVYVDLLGTTSLDEAVDKVTSAIIKQIGEGKNGIGNKLMRVISSIGGAVSLDPYSGMPQVEFGLSNRKPPSVSLDVLGEYLQSLPVPVVIAIDEFQQIVNYKEKNTESAFRSWVQEYPMIRFIFSGSHRHMMTSMFREESRPFYNSAQLIQLEHLAGTVYIPFIIEQFNKNGKDIDRTVVNDVLKWSQFQTYYVQLLCNKLFSRSNNITFEVLNDVITETIDQEGPQFSYYQRLFTQYQWNLLKALAREEMEPNPMSQAFLSKHKLGAASSASTALKALEKKEFIIYDQGGYRLHDTLFMRWLQQL